MMNTDILLYIGKSIINFKQQSLLVNPEQFQFQSSTHKDEIKVYVTTQWNRVVIRRMVHNK